jgi:beta-lactam-binding protein with PASTA domain
MSMPLPPGEPPDPADGQPDDPTLADTDDWRIPDQYDVRPAADAPADETHVLPASPAPTRTAASTERARRFPPDTSAGWAAVVLGAILLLVLGAGAVWLTGDDDTAEATPTTTQPGTTAPQTTTAPPVTGVVPDVVGEQLPEARELLEADGFAVRVEQQSSDRPADEVLSQRPPADDEAERGSVVVLTVSQGVEQVEVPNVVGMSESAAADALREEGLEPRSRPVESDERAGTVVAQSPARGTDVEPDTVVTIDVAEAPEPVLVRVPELVGERSADARARLRELGLRATQRPAESSEPAGTVVGQTPAAGAEVREGSAVTLRVSTGPPRTEVPDVVGMDESDAVSELERAGFVPQVVDEPTVEPGEDGIVVGQSPTGGTARRQGATVTIRVGRVS